MAEIFKMPKLGMDMEVGLIGRWMKAEGDSVCKGEVLAEIETDKALLEVEAPCDGTLLKLFCKEGEEAPCGAPIAAIGQPGEKIDEVNEYSCGEHGSCVLPHAQTRHGYGSGHHWQMAESRGRNCEKRGTLCGNRNR